MSLRRPPEAGAIGAAECQFPIEFPTDAAIYTAEAMRLGGGRIVKIKEQFSIAGGDAIARWRNGGGVEK